jgi:hypothetical protein
VGLTLGSTDKAKIYAVGPQGISTAKKGMNAEFIRKADCYGVWDMEGILLIEYMKKGSKIMGEVYKKTMRKLKTAIAKKAPQL